ncbi:MAG TPA: cation:proton antiporter [Acidimicrobiales bacterium]
MGEALVAIGGAFLAAGIFGRFGRRVGLPTIPFFMAAGLLFGPNTPGLVVIEHPHDLELLATFGLVLLLFHLGLEFSLGDLVAGGARLLGTGAVCILLTVGAGLLFGLGLGWGTPEALVIAGAIGISSSAIVTKLLVELKRLANPESHLILGIVVVEDIFLALYLAVLQPILGDADGLGDSAGQFATAFGFLLALAAVARWGSTFVGRLIDTPDDELLTVCFVGLAMLGAGVAAELGVSDAIGAFGAGLILAESPAAERIEHLVLPLRDAFAAVFFFAFGLSIDPGAIGGVAVPVAIAVALTLVVNAVKGVVAARMNGFRRIAASNIAFTTVGRGEFSLVLATLAVAAGLDRHIGPFVAVYVLVLAVAGPILATQTRRLSRLLPARLFPPVVVEPVPATLGALGVPGATTVPGVPGDPTGGADGTAGTSPLPPPSMPPAPPVPPGGPVEGPADGPTDGSGSMEEPTTSTG